MLQYPVFLQNRFYPTYAGSFAYQHLTVVSAGPLTAKSVQTQYPSPADYLPGFAVWAWAHRHSLLKATRLRLPATCRGLATTLHRDRLRVMSGEQPQRSLPLHGPKNSIRCQHWKARGRGSVSENVAH